MRAKRKSAKPWHDGLDPRERKFVERYVETSNGTRSALVAGYGRNYNSAGFQASTLLKRPKIKNAIDLLQAEELDRYDFTPERIIREFAKIADVNTADFITMVEQPDGTEKPVIDFSGVTRRQLAAVASVENTDKGIKYKTHDKIRALTELAKIAKLYPAERTELTGKDGGPIQTANLNAHTVDLTHLDATQRQQLRETLLMLKQSAGDMSEEDE